MKSNLRLKMPAVMAIALTIMFGGGCRRPSPTTPVSAAEDIPWERNLLLGRGVELTSSSHNLDSERIGNLLDNDPHTFWHVDLELVGLPAWVKVDFGEGPGAAVSSLAFHPRVDQTGRVFGDQFFWNVRVQASRDGDDWQDLAWLRAVRPPEVSGWYRARLDNPARFRFWRILILDGHSGKSKNFLSLADLAFFE